MTVFLHLQLHGQQLLTFLLTAGSYTAGVRQVRVLLTLSLEEASHSIAMDQVGNGPMIGVSCHHQLFRVCRQELMPNWLFARLVCYRFKNSLRSYTAA